MPATASTAAAVDRRMARSMPRGEGAGGSPPAGEWPSAVGGTLPGAHQAGLDRIALAGGKPTSVVQVGCELQRDWSRQETAEGFTQILFGGERPLAGASTEPAGNGVRAGR